MISRKQKEAIDLAVALNPTTVEITRTAYVEQDGGRSKVVTSVPAQDMLLYQDAPSKQRRNDVSGLSTIASWVALCPSTADVQWGANVVDTFIVEGLGKFRVVSGRRIMVGSDVNGTQLKLELES